MDGSLILHRLQSRKRILLLQGPGGFFFRKLNRFLTAHGCEVLQINFNGADQFFNDRTNARSFRGTPDEWPNWLNELLFAEPIESVILFGDCRPMHAHACRIVAQHQLQLLVFEEGYIRPGFVTCEADGVNARSSVAARFVEEQPALLGLMPLPDVQKIVMPSVSRAKRAQALIAMGLQATAYLLAMRLRRRHFPHYVHHKAFRLRLEAKALLTSGARKLLFRYSQASIRNALLGPLARKSFIVPLQVFNDSQITHHSRYDNQNQLIEDVVDSFAGSARLDDHLVFKHHPMDRGHQHYGKAIRSAAEKYRVTDRVHYVHDLHLPSLLRRTRGMVTINSTAGLSALYHGVPVKCLGKCLYDLPGLTHQGSLNHFWQSCAAPLGSEVLRLRSLLAQDALVRGSFYFGAIQQRSDESVVAEGKLGEDQRRRSLAKQADFGNRQNVHAYPVLEQTE